MNHCAVPGRTARYGKVPPMMLAMKRWLSVLLIGGLLSAAAHAATPPEELVKDTSQRMLKALQEEKTDLKKNPERVTALVNEIVLPHFDFVRMSKLALGRYWRRADEKQQQAFVEQFRALLVRTYRSALTEYRDQTIRYLPFSGDQSSGDVTVKTQVDQPGGSTIPIDYTLHLENDEWKVYDVVIDGISLVINYRSSFSSEIRQSGIDGLIDKLRKRNQDDSGG
jgi:phospholipid transport system substrate-binding protein